MNEEKTNNSKMKYRITRIIFENGKGVRWAEDVNVPINDLGMFRADMVKQMNLQQPCTDAYFHYDEKTEEDAGPDAPSTPNN